MIKYGLISETDGKTLEKTIDLICNEFPNETINVAEVGIYSGESGNGLREYIHSKNREIFLTGIDNKKDNEEIRFSYDKLIIGNSSEVYDQIQDNSQHLIFVDGDHSYIGVISDFFAYCDKVKRGAYFCFHDTGKHISKFKDFQHGDKENPDAYVSVRKALEKIGLFSSYLHYAFDTEYPKPEFTKWELIFDEADETNPAGGICVFRKLY